MGKEMDALIRRAVGINDRDFKKIVAGFSQLLPLFMFRRNEASKWFGHPLLELPNLVYTTHRVSFPGDCQSEKTAMNQA